MRKVELHHGARTDVGRVREVNEDAFLAAPPVFVVADGMGGHDGGDVASRIVVEEFERFAEGSVDPARVEEQVSEVLGECQRRLADYSARHGSGGGPRANAGTTVVAAMLVDDEQPGWVLANLGDSRVYRLSAGRLEQVSVDHSVVQELVDAGRISPEEAAVHPERHVITRALGGRDDPTPDYFRLPLGDVDRLLLCSDGVSGMLEHADMEQILVEAEDPRDAADRLVDAALVAGGRDNATVVVVDVLGWGEVPDHDPARERATLEQELGALP